MDALRLVLIIIGLIIIAIIYFISRRESDSTFSFTNFFQQLVAFVKNLIFRLAAHFPQKSSQSPHPVESDHIAVEEIESFGSFVAERQAIIESESDSTETEVKIDYDDILPEGEELVISISVMAKQGRAISGDRFLDATNQMGLSYGKMNIYHRMALDKNGREQIVCSVANMLEPGTFDLDNIDSFSTPGLTLFMILPGPLESDKAFEILLETGEQLANLLDAELCDERRSKLTKQTIDHIKEKIDNYRFKQKMTNLQRHRSREV